MESQSRYGIMDELTEKKLKAQTELSALEGEKARKEAESTGKIDALEKQIKEKAATYKSEHVNWRKTKEVEIRLLTAETERKIAEINEQITESDESYESDYELWASTQQQNLDILNRQMEVDANDSDRKIKAKREIISGVEEGIKNLKEMSKEQAKVE